MENYLIIAGFLLIFVGILAIVIGSILNVKSGDSEVKVKGGGVIFIGPIPVAFGTDPKSVIIISILMLLLMLLYLVFYQRLQ